MVLTLMSNISVLWGPCHQGTARPQVADRGDGCQIWRVAANILNKQSLKTDKGKSSSLGVGPRVNNPSYIRKLSYLERSDFLSRHYCVIALNL